MYIRIDSQLTHPHPHCTCQSVVHVETVEFDLFQVQTAVNEHSAKREKKKIEIF